MPPDAPTFASTPPVEAPIFSNLAAEPLPQPLSSQPCTRPHDCLQDPRAGPASAPHQKEATVRLAPHTRPSCIGWVGAAALFPAADTPVLSSAPPTPQVSWAGFVTACPPRSQGRLWRRAAVNCLSQKAIAGYQSTCSLQPLPSPPITAGVLREKNLDHSEDQRRCQQGP